MLWSDFYAISSLGRSAMLHGFGSACTDIDGMSDLLLTPH